MEWLPPVFVLGLIILVLRLMRGEAGQAYPLQERPAALDSGAWDTAMTAAALMGAAGLADHAPTDGGGMDAGGGGL
jgi:hypothetical protein